MIPSTISIATCRSRSDYSDLAFSRRRRRMVPVELARSFDRLLSDQGIEHDYVEVSAGHCDFDFRPIVPVRSDHLVGEELPWL